MVQVSREKIKDCRPTLFAKDLSKVKVRRMEQRDGRWRVRWVADPVFGRTSDE